MVVLYLEALAAMALSLSVLMTGAWLVQQRTGNSGWVDTFWRRENLKGNCLQRGATQDATRMLRGIALFVL